METEWRLAQLGIPHGYKQVGGDQFIAKARNRLITEFLTEYPMATDLFFIDDDVGWPADAVIKFLNRPEDIVAGAYPKKTDKPEFPVELSMGEDGGLIEKDGLYQANLAPTGFMRIKRRVLEALVKDCPTYTEACIEGKAQRWALFEAGANYDKGEWWGEDYVFCQKARNAGFSVWIDPDIEFTHRGNKRWAGNFIHAVNEWKSKKEAA